MVLTPEIWKDIRNVEEGMDSQMVQVGRLLMVDLHIRPSGMIFMEDLKTTVTNILETKEIWELKGTVDKVTTAGGTLMCRWGGKCKE